MKRLIIIASTMLGLTGCQLEQPPFEVMQVNSFNNQPCFMIPEDVANKKDKLTSNGVMVSWLDQKQWKVISPPGDSLPERTVSAGECTIWGNISWNPGEYSVLMRLNNASENDSLRLRSDFFIKKDNAGKITVIHKM